MIFKIVDNDVRIVSMGYAESGLNIPDGRNLIFLYYPKDDLVIINEDHPNSCIWKELLPRYLKLSDSQKKMFYEAMREGLEKPDMILEGLNLVSRICRIRRHRKVVNAA